MGNEWNDPSRSDYYLMQLAAIECRQKGKQIDANQFKIHFAFKPKSKPRKMTKEQLAKTAKAAKARMLAGTVRKPRNKDAQ